MADLKKYLTGKIKYWNPYKGYGFITCDGSGEDYFFHYTNQADPDDKLSPDVRVSFDEGLNRNGICAKNVERL
ncbi:MAG: cold shock domain-containing protein [Candidatus Cloacimonetes bacterium]|nr:cold shock domain-containing protein [Candidatus Cloacimonadota bacterium]